MQDSPKILIFTTTTEPVDPYGEDRMRGAVEIGDPYSDDLIRGPVDMARRVVDKAVEVSTQTLKDSVLTAYQNCLDIIQSLPQHSGGASLQTVTFSLAINSEGQVGLLSTSAQVGAQMSLTFEVRIPPHANAAE